MKLIFKNEAIEKYKILLKYLLFLYSIRPIDINRNPKTSGFGILINNSIPGSDKNESIDIHKYFLLINVLLSK